MGNCLDCEHQGQPLCAAAMEGAAEMQNQILQVIFKKAPEPELEVPFAALPAWADGPGATTEPRMFEFYGASGATLKLGLSGGRWYKHKDQVSTVVASQFHEVLDSALVKTHEENVDMEERIKTLREHKEKLQAKAKALLAKKHAVEKEAQQLKLAAMLVTSKQVETTYCTVEAADVRCAAQVVCQMSYEAIAMAMVCAVAEEASTVADNGVVKLCVDTLPDSDDDTATPTSDHSEELYNLIETPLADLECVDSGGRTGPWLLAMD